MPPKSLKTQKKDETLSPHNLYADYEEIILSHLFLALKKPLETIIIS